MLNNRTDKRIRKSKGFLCDRGIALLSLDNRSILAVMELFAFVSSVNNRWRNNIWPLNIERKEIVRASPWEVEDSKHFLLLEEY